MRNIANMSICHLSIDNVTMRMKDQQGSHSKGPAIAACVEEAAGSEAKAKENSRKRKAN